MGLFLMESLRITRLFPVIGALPDKTRVRMIWITLRDLRRGDDRMRAENAGQGVMRIADATISMLATPLS